MQLQALQSYHYEFRLHLDNIYARLFYYVTFGCTEVNLGLVCVTLFFHLVLHSWLYLAQSLCFNHQL